MKKRILIIITVAVILVAALSLTACSSGGGLWKLSNIDTSDVTRIELMNSGGTIKVLEGERLTKFMDELGQLPATKNDDAYPEDSYDYRLRIYISGSEGYLEYELGQELTKVNIKSGAKESFYIFDDYEKARELVAKYFYEK